MTWRNIAERREVRPDRRDRKLHTRNPSRDLLARGWRSRLEIVLEILGYAIVLLGCVAFAMVVGRSSGD